LPKSLLIYQEIATYLTYIIDKEQVDSLMGKIGSPISQIIVV